VTDLATGHVASATGTKRWSGESASTYLYIEILYIEIRREKTDRVVREQALTFEVEWVRSGR